MLQVLPDFFLEHANSITHGVFFCNSPYILSYSVNTGSIHKAKETLSDSNFQSSSIEAEGDLEDCSSGA